MKGEGEREKGRSKSQTKNAIFFFFARNTDTSLVLVRLLSHPRYQQLRQGRSISAPYGSLHSLRHLHSDFFFSRLPRALNFWTFFMVLSVFVLFFRLPSEGFCLFWNFLTFWAGSSHVRFPAYHHMATWMTSGEKEAWTNYDDNLTYFYTSGLDADKIIERLTANLSNNEKLFLPDPMTGDTPLLAVSHIRYPAEKIGVSQFWTFESWRVPFYHRSAVGLRSKRPLQQTQFCWWNTVECSPSVSYAINWSCSVVRALPCNFWRNLKEEND